MHSIALNVNNHAYEHLIYFLSNLKDDVKITADKIYNDEFSIDEEHCLKTLEKINSGELADFKTIDDVDLHIKELINDIG